MMKLSLAAVVLLPLLCQSGTFLNDDDLNHHWNLFKTVHGKNYGEESLEEHRKTIFKANLHRIIKHNFNHDLGMSSFRMGLNEFADRSLEEMTSQMTGYIPTFNFTGPMFQKTKGMKLPDHVDWRTKGYVTEVKHQNGCGSCWAFASTGALEGQHFRKTGQLVSLSEQNLIDCVKTNNACRGGYIYNAYQYAKDNHGIASEDAYPYTAGGHDKCQYNSSGIGSTCQGYQWITGGDEEALQQAVATLGPIAVAIEYDYYSFFLYESGIIDEPRCRSYLLSHAVLVVGYGTENGKDYWLLKNSWGKSYGIDGYFKMVRNKNNQCGIAWNCLIPLV